MTLQMQYLTATHLREPVSPQLCPVEDVFQTFGNLADERSLFFLLWWREIEHIFHVLGGLAILFFADSAQFCLPVFRGVLVFIFRTSLNIRNINVCIIGAVDTFSVCYLVLVLLMEFFYYVEFCVYSQICQYFSFILLDCSYISSHPNVRHLSVSPWFFLSFHFFFNI